MSAPTCRNCGKGAGSHIHPEGDCLTVFPARSWWPGPTYAELEADVARLTAALAARDAEWLAAMPRCHHFDDGPGGAACGKVSTREERGGMCDAFDLHYWCDEHAEGHDCDDADWASLVRRATAGAKGAT